MKLFRESIEYVKNLIYITDQLLVIIMQTRKILLFETQNDGLKKSGTKDFRLSHWVLSRCKSM